MHTNNLSPEQKGWVEILVKTNNRGWKKVSKLCRRSKNLIKQLFETFMPRFNNIQFFSEEHVCIKGVVRIKMSWVVIFKKNCVFESSRVLKIPLSILLEERNFTTFIVEERSKTGRNKFATTSEELNFQAENFLNFTN